MVVSLPEVLGAMCWRTWVKTFRRPVTLTFSFFQPLMWMLFFGFLFHRYSLEGLPRGVTYLDFLTPGVCTMTVLFGASQSGIGWIRDLQTGFLSRMFLCPAKPEILLLGKVLADVLRLLGQALVVLFLGLLLGARLHPHFVALPLALLALALFAAALASLSCAVALRTQAQEAMAAFVHVINMPLLFTSTVLVPQRQMPEWLAALSAWNPLTLTVEAWRGALLLGTLPSLSHALLPLALLALLLFGVAWRAMKGVAHV